LIGAIQEFKNSRSGDQPTAVLFDKCFAQWRCRLRVVHRPESSTALLLEFLNS
jgi:hypothetical protein